MKAELLFGGCIVILAHDKLSTARLRERRHPPAAISVASPVPPLRLKHLRGNLHTKTRLPCAAAVLTSLVVVIMTDVDPFRRGDIRWGRNGNTGQVPHSGFENIEFWLGEEVVHEDQGTAYVSSLSPRSGGRSVVLTIVHGPDLQMQSGT